MYNDFTYDFTSHTFTMSDRQFIGWYTLSGTEVETSGTWATTGAVTLTAKWIYIVIFDAGDGKIVGDTAALVTYSLLFTYTQCAIHDGYKFVG